MRSRADHETVTEGPWNQHARSALSRDGAKGRNDYELGRPRDSGNSEVFSVQLVCGAAPATDTLSDKM